MSYYCASGPEFCRASFLSDPSSLCHTCSRCQKGLHVFCFGSNQEGGAKLCAKCIVPQGISRDALDPPLSLQRMTVLGGRGRTELSPVPIAPAQNHVGGTEIGGGGQGEQVGVRMVTSPVMIAPAQNHMGGAEVGGGGRMETSPVTIAPAQNHVGAIAPDRNDDDIFSDDVRMLVGVIEYNGHSHNIDLSKETDDRETKCAYACRSKCLIRSKEVLNQGKFLCYAAGCNKVLHPICSFRMTHENKNGEFFYEQDVNQENKVTVLLCGKECYNKYKRAIDEKEKESYKKANSGWTDDGENSNGMTSMDVLLKWITDERNCDRYFGSQTSSAMTSVADKAVTKNDLCKEIVDIIHQKVGNYNRTVNSVRTKIDALISSFKIADEFALNTGQGIRENEGEERFEECVKQRCAYYFDLLPVMQDRHSIRPCFTTDFEDDSSYGSEEGHQSGDPINTSMNSFADMSIISSTTSASMTSSGKKMSTSGKTTKTSEKCKAPAIEAKHKARALAKTSTQKRDAVSTVLDNIGLTAKAGSHDVYMAKKSEMMEKRLKRFDEKMEFAQRRLQLDEKRFTYDMEQSDRRIKMDEKRLIYDMEQSDRRMKMEEMSFQLEHNKEVLRQRLEFRRNFPNVTDEELDNVFPFHKS